MQPTETGSHDRLAHNERQQEEFDGLVSRFADAVLSEKEIRHVRAIVDAGCVEPGSTVLDVGTGAGVLLGPIHDRSPGEVWACDLSPGMVAAARREWPSVTFVVADIIDFPHPATAFDAIYCNAMFGNVADQHAALRTCARLLAPGGRVVIGHPLGRGFVDRLHRDEPDIVPHTLPARDDLVALAASAGLVVADLVDTDELYIAVLTRGETGATGAAGAARSNGTAPDPTGTASTVDDADGPGGTPEGHAAPSTFVVFDRRSRLYSCGYDGRIIAWADDHRTVRWAGRHEGLLNAVGVGDRWVATGGADRRIRLWSVEDGTPSPTEFPVCAEDVNALVLTGDEKVVVAAADDGRLYAYDTATGNLLWVRYCAPPARYGESIESLGSWTTGGRQHFVAVNNSGNVAVFDVEGTLLRTVDLPSTDVDIECCAIDDARSVLWSGTAEGTLLGLPLSTDPDAPVAEPTTLQAHDSAVKAIACLADGRVLSSAYDGTLRVNDPAADTPLVLGLVDDRRRGWARSLAVDPGHPDTVVSTCTASAPQVWDLGRRELAVDEAPDTFGANCCVSVHARLVVGLDNGQLVTLEDGVAVELARLPGMVLALAGHDEHFVVVAGTTTGTLRMVDLGTGHTVAELTTPGDPVVCCAFDATGDEVSVGYYSGLVRTVSVPGFAVGREFRATDTIKALTYGEGHSLYVAAADGVLSRWDTRTGTQERQAGGLFLLNGVDWNPTTRLVTTAGRDRAVRVWGPDLDLRATRPCHRRSIKAVATSPEGSVVASTGYDATVVLHGPGDREVTLRGHEYPGVPALRWLDSELVLSVGWDQTARIWSVSDGLLQTIPLQPVVGGGVS